MSFALILQVSALIFGVLAAICAFWAALISEKGENIVNYFQHTTVQQPVELSTEMKKVDPVMIKLTYKAPAHMDKDVCTEGVCEGEYILLGESLDSIRIDSPNSTEFKASSYRYDSGPLNPETGTYEKIISDWQGEEVRNRGQFDFPKARILSREITSYATTTPKQIWNYDTTDEFGSKIVQ